MTVPVADTKPVVPDMFGTQREQTDRTKGDLGKRMRRWMVMGCTGTVALVVGLFLLALLLIKLVWAWTIPDLFPGAVEQGLVAKSLSWFTTIKLAIFVALLGGLAGVHRGGKS